jgi:hypothetical protein
VARTSKTPTSLYFADCGFKDANVPVGLNIPTARPTATPTARAALPPATWSTSASVKVRISFVIEDLLVGCRRCILPDGDQRLWDTEGGREHLPTPTLVDSSRSQVPSG